MDDDQEVMLITQTGYGIVFPLTEIRAMGRITSGVKGINLKDEDKVVGVIDFIDRNLEGIIVATTKGKGKRIKGTEFVSQLRAGRGVTIIKLDEDDSIAATAKDDVNVSSLLIIGKPNTICIPIEEIPVQTKVGSGIELIKRSQILSIIAL